MRFVDAHTHLELLSLYNPQLVGARSIAEVLNLIRTLRSPAVIWGWREENLGAPLRREHIDPVPLPLLLLRIDCHVGVLNRAMEELLCPEPSPFYDPEKGYLYEKALWEAVDRFKPKGAELEASLRRALRKAASLGLVEVHDFVDAELAQMYLRIGNDLPLRVVLMPYYEEYREVCSLLRRKSNSRIVLGWVKVFVDGSLSARTAYLKEPYADRRGWKGILLKNSREIARIIRELEGAGLRVALHAIGDAALEECLKAFESASPRLSYHRIEHAELITKDQALRIRSLKLLLSLQPGFVPYFRKTYLKALGANRAGRILPLRLLDELGVDMIFGSDMLPFDPLYGFRYAVRLLGRKKAQYYYGGWRYEGKYL